MDAIVELPLLLRIGTWSESLAIRPNESSTVSESRVTLTLRAERGTPVRLVSGEWLENVDVRFSFSSVHESPQALDSALKPGTVGFLCYAIGTGHPPIVHGAALWPAHGFPASLSNPVRRRCVILTLANVPISVSREHPFVLDRNRANAVLITTVEFTATDDAAA